MTPVLAILHRDEIDSEASENSLLGEHPGNLGAARLDVEPIGPLSRKTTAKENLAGGAAQYLVVRRNGTDPAHRAELVLIKVPGHSASLESEPRQALADPGKQCRAGRRVRQVKYCISLAGKSFVELDNGLTQGGLSRLQFRESTGKVVCVGKVLVAER